MSRPGRWMLSILLVASLALSFLPPTIGEARDGATSSRATVTIDFPLGGGSNTEVNVAVPHGSAVYYASMDLFGSPLGDPAQLTKLIYTDTTNNSAWHGFSGEMTPLGSPTNYTMKPLTLLDYTYLETSDGNNAVSSIDAPVWNVSTYTHFMFSVGSTPAVNLTFLWEGHSRDNFSMSHVDIYVRNMNTASWDWVDGYNSSDTINDVILMWNATDCANYISAGGDVDVLAYGPFRGNPATDNSTLFTDHVYLNVTRDFRTYPYNVNMDIGNDGSIDWSGPVGNLAGGMTLGGPEGLGAKMQAFVASAGPGPGDIIIPFKFTSERAGRLEVSNVTVLTAMAIPNTFALDEDTDAIGLIDLSGYFPVVGGPGGLTFSVSFEQNASLLHAEIGTDGHSLSFFTPTENWCGAMTFRVKAMDTQSHIYESNTFNVSVRPVNDRPVIPPVPAQVATQGTPFHLKVAASDADMPYDVAESLTFSDNSSMFAIDPKAGTIDFTPTNADVGPHAIAVYVSDRMGANASVSFGLTVNNTNDRPTIDPIGDKDVKVPEYLSFNVTAHDQDAPYGDTLSFSDDTPLFDIDGKTGMVFFSAIGFQVGRYVITITVTDAYAASASTTFNLSVRNLAGTFNRAPAITPTGDITATEDLPFNLAISASDPDGDGLRFSDDTDLFAIDPVTGVISFTPTNADVGTYLVGITVVDPEGLHASFALNLTVLNVNDPPNATILAPKSGAVFDKSDIVTLLGMGEDIDAGDILNFTWYDKDLLLGYGPNVTLADIGPGEHIVMLVVRDSAGVNATAYVDFRVNESPGLRPTAKPIIGREAAVAMSTISIFSLVLALFVAGTEVGKFGFIKFLLPLYSKIQGDAILDKYIRGKIHGYICANPGSHYSLIKQDLDVHNGTLTHHLTMLEKSGFVCSSSDGFYKRFYPAKMPIPQGKFYPNPLQTSMLTVIDRHPGISQSDLAREMNLRRQIVNYHIHILSDFGIVDVQKDGKASRVFKKGHEPGTGPSTDMEIVGGDQPEEGGFVELELDEAGNRPEEK